jgi:neuronal guanine nucleotide exchange factor
VVTFVGWYEIWCVVVNLVGWYQGERIRDGEKGWFPGNYTLEVASAHARARNIKQLYRLLALSGNFLEAQRKEKQAK